MFHKIQRIFYFLCTSATHYSNRVKCWFFSVCICTNSTKRITIEMEKSEYFIEIPNTYHNIATRNIFDCTKISDAEYFLGGVNDPKQCHIKLKTYVHTFSIFCVFFLYIKIFIYIFLLFVWAFTFLAAVVSYCFNWENTPFYTRAKLVIIKMMMRMTIR